MSFNKVKRLAILAAVCLFSAHQAPAQIQNSSAPMNAPSAAQITAKIEEYMTAASRDNRFSGSILVARDGKPLVSKSYGMANFELNVPNSPQTIFRLGSLTKPFTATAIMMLQERGKLNINDLICKHLADCPPAWQAVTVKNLLTHTSGIPDYVTAEFVDKVALPMSPSEVTAHFKNKPLEFKTGEKIAYSNSGYHLLGFIIERASGKSYADFLRENIFTPLNLKQTGYDDNRRIIKNRAAGYQLRREELTNSPHMDMTSVFAAGGLYSTTEDLLAWEQAYYTDKLISRQSRDEMFTAFKETRGLGWSVRDAFNRKMHSHSGGILGFTSYIARFPEDRVTVIVLANIRNSPSPKIGTDLAAIVFGAKYDVPQERK